MNHTLNPSRKRILSLLILLISSIGFITYITIPGKQVIYLCIVFFLNYNSVKKIPKRWANITVALILLYSLLFFIKGIIIPWYVPVSMVTALVCLSVYYQKEELFLEDFKKILNFFMYYQLVGVLLIFFLPSLFTTVFLDFAEYKTFLGLFWYNTNGGPSFFDELRFTGIAWEVGIWQFFLNANLIFAFHSKKSTKYIALCILAIVTTFSTSAYFILMFVIGSNLLISNKIKGIHVLFFILFGVLSYPLIKENIQDKFTGKNAGSGLTRAADLIIGIKLLQNNPILGSDVDNGTASSGSSEIWDIKKDLWIGNFTDGAFEGYMTVKNSNGLLRFMIDWGLPVSIFLLIITARSNLILDKKIMFIFFTTLCLSMFSEPISRTSFFYFFILSGFLFKNKNR